LNNISFLVHRKVVAKEVNYENCKNTLDMFTVYTPCREACSDCLNHHYIIERAGQGCTEKQVAAQHRMVEQGRVVEKIFWHDLLVVRHMGGATWGHGCTNVHPLFLKKA
jgi:hypothetical protein